MLAARHASCPGTRRLLECHQRLCSNASLSSGTRSGILRLLRLCAGSGRSKPSGEDLLGSTVSYLSKVGVPLLTGQWAACAPARTWDQLPRRALPLLSRGTGACLNHNAHASCQHCAPPCCSIAHRCSALLIQVCPYRRHCLTVAHRGGCRRLQQTSQVVYPAQPALPCRLPHSSTAASNRNHTRSPSRHPCRARFPAHTQDQLGR